jgi:hypothetical protein
MKRSEMEEKIQQHLLENGCTQAVDIPGLLEFLVEQGMQPPAYRLYSLDREWDCYDWEDEDEKK